MTKEQAITQLRDFLNGVQMLTFTITEYPGEKWVAQCNQVESVLTGGVGYDTEIMSEILKDAVLTAAGIPAEHANLLKQVWYTPEEEPIAAEIDANASVRLYHSKYIMSQYVPA